MGRSVSSILPNGAHASRLAVLGGSAPSIPNGAKVRFIATHIRVTEHIGRFRRGRGAATWLLGLSLQTSRLALSQGGRDSRSRRKRIRAQHGRRRLRPPATCARRPAGRENTASSRWDTLRILTTRHDEKGVERAALRTRIFQNIISLKVARR